MKTYIPLLAIPCVDLSLRSELLYLFKQTGIDPSDVCTLDDVFTLDLLHTHLLLIDHNVPRDTIHQLFHPDRKQQVEGIIDHHEQEPFYSTDQQSSMSVHDIQPSGSCCSLVTKYMMQPPGPDLLRSQPEETHGAAVLLLAAILIDTVNMTSKVCEIDILATDFLSQFLSELQFGEFYSRMRDVKMSIMGMVLQDILRRDYKEYNTRDGKLGMSTVTRTITFLCEHFPDFATGYVGFVMERGLAVHITMMVDGQGEQFHRGGMVVAENAEFVSKFEERGGVEYGILGEFVDGLQMEGGMRWWVYEMKDLSASRKQIAPLAQEIMNTNKS